MSSSPAGPAAIIAATGVDLGEFAEGLEGCGFSVAQAASEQDDLAGWRQALVDAAEAAGGCDLVAICHLPPGARPAPLVDYDPSAWSRDCNKLIRRTLFSLQAAQPLMRARGGGIVGLGPSASLAGVGDCVALTTAIEGQRTLIKSAARQWSSSGIAVNWIAIEAEQLLPGLAGLAGLHRMDASSRRLAPPRLGAGVAAVAAMLASKSGRVLAGQTLAVDGAEWMMP